MQYNGELLDGEPHGQGTVAYADGSRFEGVFVRGRRHGPGTLTRADGNVTRGTWADGVLLADPKESAAVSAGAGAGACAAACDPATPPVASAASTADAASDPETAAWAAECVQAAQVHAAEHSEAEPPVLLEDCFDPAALLGGDPAAWCDVLRALAPALPVQLHQEPYAIAAGLAREEGVPALFQRACATLAAQPALAEHLATHVPTGEPRRARIKLRLAAAGKFIHRNRFRRRQVLAILHGQQHWLFLSSPGSQAADEYMRAASNLNWNGFRSNAYPAQLSLEQMHALAAGAPPGVTARVLCFRAGSLLAFDGRWWHGTCYSSPVLNLFFTPGDDCEVALKQHKLRHAMPLQKSLRLCSVSMAKASRLGDAWNVGRDGRPIDWAALGGVLPAAGSGAAPAAEEEQAPPAAPDT